VVWQGDQTYKKTLLCQNLLVYNGLRQKVIVHVIWEYETRPLCLCFYNNIWVMEFVRGHMTWRRALKLTFFWHLKCPSLGAPRLYFDRLLKQYINFGQSNSHVVKKNVVKLIIWVTECSQILWNNVVATLQQLYERLEKYLYMHFFFTWHKNATLLTLTPASSDKETVGHNRGWSLKYIGILRRHLHGTP
jgi:hypothetical protein